MLRGVTVDWWWTLASPSGGDRDWTEFSKRVRVEGVARVLEERGVACTREQLASAYDGWRDRLVFRWKHLVDPPPREQVLGWLARADIQVDDESVLDALFEPIGAPLLERPPLIHEGAAEALRTLKARGLKLAIISNTGLTWGRFLRVVQDRAGLAGLFDHRTFSDEVGIRKPAPPIFEQTLDALKLSPEDVVHLGDDVDADVAGAKGVGMRAIWYDTGLWKDAVPAKADAVVHAWKDLPAAVEGW